RNVPEGGPSPLEAPLDFGAIEHREIGEGRRLSDHYGPGKAVLYALLSGTGGGYDRVLLTADRDAGDPIATLRVGEWSSWLPITYPQTKQKGYVRVRLLALSADGREFTLYTTSVMPDRGWAHPVELGPELTQRFGPFMPNINGCDTNQDFARLATTLGEAGENAVLDLCRFQCEWMVDAARHITAKEDWGFLWTQSHIPDNVQHLWMDMADPLTTDEPETNARYAALIDRAYEILDDFVGGMMSLADDETIIVAVSDHGFLPHGRGLPLVELFEQKGLLTFRSDDDLARQVVGATPTQDTHRLEKAFWTERVDWEKTLAVPLSENEVYVNLKGREPHGIVEPGRHFEEVRTRVIDLLLDYRDPQTGERLVNLALRKEECRSLGLWGDRVGDVIFTQTAVTGGHGKQLPVADRGSGSIDGFLCMSGPRIKKGYTLQRTAWIVDVVPTLSHLMNLPFPRDCEGAILHQLIES
ncbi:MAG: alkaline phosphatase family protein, partial [Planctomycetes bacterium]|nr:alkaline phosphatase family protein [Planctomycetota bacterium]